MFNILISGFALVLMVFMYQQCYVYHGVQEIYLGLYKGIAEHSVVNVIDGETSEPRFYVPLAKEMFSRYVDANMPLYTKTYNVSVVGSAIGDYTKRIIVTLNAKISDTMDFERKAVFAIRRNY